MTICVQYRRQKYNKWVSLWDEWKLLDLWIKPWRYYIGNFRIFGWNWNTFIANICLTSPLLNKIIHWKIRHLHLEVPYTTRDTLEVIDGGKHPSNKSEDGNVYS